MADVAPLKTITFTVKQVPQRTAQVKTIRRLMQMQRDVQRALDLRARLRRREDNKRGIRSGRIWVDRAKASKVVRVEPGETFTLTVTPQIMPDLESVKPFLEAKAAG